MFYLFRIFFSYKPGYTLYVPILVWNWREKNSIRAGCCTNPPVSLLFWLCYNFHTIPRHIQRNIECLLGGCVNIAALLAKPGIFPLMVPTEPNFYSAKTSTALLTLSICTHIPIQNSVGHVHERTYVTSEKNSKGGGRGVENEGFALGQRWGNILRVGTYMAISIRTKCWRAIG